MFFQAVLPVLLISAFAAAAPAPASPGNSRVHTPKPINIDTVIFNRLEKLFEDSAAPSNSTIVARASSDTRDDINNGYCDDVVIIFARGTSGKFQCRDQRNNELTIQDPETLEPEWVSPSLTLFPRASPAVSSFKVSNRIRQRLYVIMIHEPFSTSNLTSIGRLPRWWL